LRRSLQFGLLKPAAFDIAANGEVSSPTMSNITLRSISTSPSPRIFPNEKLGLRMRPACTRSASAIPSSAKEACRPLLLSKATCTAVSGVSGLLSSRFTLVSMDSVLLPGLKNWTVWPVRSLVRVETVLSPPSCENVAHPVSKRATRPSVRGRRRGIVC
jgi:hypothetical protein